MADEENMPLFQWVCKNIFGENDDAKTVDGLKATILALKDDVKTHLKNIYALCDVRHYYIEKGA